MILLDTSGILAAFDSAEPQHEVAARCLLAARPPFLLSPFVLAEVDYLLLRHIGMQAETVFLQDVSHGAYKLEPFTGEDVAEALKVLHRYADLRIGLAEASIVVLAERHSARDVLTLDERHFRTLRGPRGRPFRILPSDEG